MKSINTSFVIGLVALGTLFGTRTVEATVGGPTLIGNLSYNPEDESVYYVLQSYSGKGCPPSLENISLASEVVTTALSCAEGSSLIGGDYSRRGQVSQRIGEMTQGFKYPSPISLSKNKIQVDVDFVKSETLKDSPDFVTRSLFVASVYQNGGKINEFEIVGCGADQPFSFAGYAIPGFEKKIVLLSSTKGDCWEGGYTFERLHVIGGVRLLDRTSTGSDYKGYESALVPSASTLVVFEKDTAPAVSAAVTTSGTAKGLVVPYGTIVMACASLILGVFLGRVRFGKR